MVRFARASWLLVTIFCLSPATTHAQARAAQPALTIVKAGPAGEIADRSEANEIRVVFSEPMVALGRIPEKVDAPFFQMTPAVPGTFRWSGTTILIFTPDPKRPLPYATKFAVTITTAAAAVSGRRLAEPYRFAFTTPTVKLLSTNWYRRGGRAGAQMVVLLRFNQPVRPGDIAAHLASAFDPHDWAPPAFDPVDRLKTVDPTAHERFAAKVATTRAAAAAAGPVQLRLTNDWDKAAWPASPDLVVFESVTPVPPESHVRLALDATTPSPAGAATPGQVQSYTIQVERAFFIDGFYCATGCDPDRRNPLEMRSVVKTADFAAALRALDVTGGSVQEVVKPASPKPGRHYTADSSAAFTLEDGGYDAQPPARTFELRIAPTLTSLDGQTLGYTWSGVVENWRRRAFTSFGDGHGVWERSGGATLPFYARNLKDVTQWTAPVQPADLMPTLLSLEAHRFGLVPPGEGTPRRLGGAFDRVLSHGLDVSRSLTNGVGLVWAGIREGDPIPQARTYSDGRARERSTIVQVTNLGISVKDSPQNTLVLVTRLDTGEPVGGAQVSIVETDNKVVWRGTTGSDGTALAPAMPLRDPQRWWEFAFVVLAEKDGDVAYVGSDWNEGILPWDFGSPFDLDESSPLLRGTVFSDRGVYRLGEEVHFKAILRHNTPSGIRLLPAGTPVFITVRDSQDRPIDQRTVTVNAWSSAEWTFRLPAEGALGHYSVRAVLESEKPKVRPPEELRTIAEPGPETDEYLPHTKYVTASFLVAAYRRPDFRVDVTLTGENPIAGAPLKGVVSARYLFGAAMGTRPVKWAFTKSPLGDAPAAVRERFPHDRWSFVGWSERQTPHPADVARDEATLAAGGDLALTLDTARDAGIPYSYTLEGDVEDVSRQHIANRTSLVVHPAPWYIGIKQPPYFVDRKNGLSTEVIAVTPDGRVAPGVEVEVTLTQIQWNSVRRAEGNGFYTWDTERKDVPAGSWKVTSGVDPVPLQLSLPNGGYFVLEATARETGGRFASTRASFYALGEGYTAWMRYDHQRIELVPERKTYKPGDTARIMIQSPWEQATALVTTEREGIRSHRQFRLTSTQESISIPIAEEDIPNVFVSVLLIRGRTSKAVETKEVTLSPSWYREAPVTDDPSDPGKPAFRLGYVELKVEDASKRLSVGVTANKEEYRPANNAKVSIEVKDHRGEGAASEVTLWAVDYGVLSLTSYRTPDVLGSVYVHKALQVMNADSRQRIISRRVLTPKGETEGGGGGADPGAGTLRKDFRVLAFWLGSVITDARGRASVDVKLPESLTTYRIMAVAGDRASRFGSGSGEVRINKPLTLKPTFPRFLAVGDKAHFGAVVTSQLSTPGTATVTIRSLDPELLLFGGATEQRVDIPAGGSVEARFDAAGRAIGRARVRMTVAMGNETDAFEDVIPVEVLASPEVVAAYGEAAGEMSTATEKLTIPRGVIPNYGGLHVEMASTAMVGLGEGARYLVEYPYGCAEQRASRTLAMLLAADLGDAFTLPGVDTGKIRPAVQTALRDLERYQCSDGGFAYWPGKCHTVSPYLTSYVLHVFKSATDLEYDVTPEVRARAYSYLEQALAANQPVNEGWWPSYTAWQAFAVKVLVEGGRQQDSNLNRLYTYRDRMPVFALAYLLDALVAKGEKTGPRVTDLRRRIANAILPEAGSAHVEELSDPYLLWFWNSNIRSTAIVLNTLVKSDTNDAPVRQLVRWLMAVRKHGRWGNTQENAHAMQSLVSYYRKYESVVPDFRATVRLGDADLAREQFQGRSTASVTKAIPMAEVLSKGQPGASHPLTFTREGAGTLFYTTRLRYASDELFQDGLDSGFNIARRYEPFVESGTRPASAAYKAGDLVRVTLTFHLTKERRFVAVTDPLPAGFEAVESWFATTAASLAAKQDEQVGEGDDWTAWWRRGGFDHVERHDDRVNLFATRLSEGVHEFSYIVRATTAGTFRTAPARAEEMYEPEIFGRTATAVVEVRK